MNDKEISQACIALKHWFQSQDIPPPDGFRIMSRMMGWCLVDKTTDSAELKEGMLALTALIAWEIAWQRETKLSV